MPEVETEPHELVRDNELFRTDAAGMAVATQRLVERTTVIDDVREDRDLRHLSRELSCSEPARALGHLP